MSMIVARSGLGEPVYFETVEEADAATRRRAALTWAAILGLALGGGVTGYWFSGRSALGGIGGAAVSAVVTWWVAMAVTYPTPYYVRGRA